MADGGSETDIREILDDANFTFEGKDYKIIQNSKPSKETKTDFYILAKSLNDNATREFKISYKKNTFSFVENKVKTHRIPHIYGKNWSEILKNQIKPLKDSFNQEVLVNFVNETIKLGWRYEIEQMDAPGIGGRSLSQKIQQNIAHQVLWGENCSEKMCDALVDGKKIKNSGIPDYILIKNPDEIKTANDVFSDLQDIRNYAENHSEMRAGFIAQNYRWSFSNKKWKTEGFSRGFAVWIDWSVENKKLVGTIITDKPFEKTAGDVIENLHICLDKIGIPHNSGSVFKTLRTRIGKTVVIKQ